MAVAALLICTRRRALLAFKAAIIALVAMILGACSKSPTPYIWNLPHNIPPPPVPADNPVTEESVILGEKLFFDKGLSANNTVSCSSCHEPEHAFSEPKTVSVGANGDALNRNALALVNVAYNASFTWAHNNLESIEKQLMIPLFNEHPVEMGVTGNEKRILKRFEGSEYRALF